MSLWEKYINGDLPHIHHSSDMFQDTFEDALSIQAERICDNLKLAFPSKKKEEILMLMFNRKEW